MSTSDCIATRQLNAESAGARWCLVHQRLDAYCELLKRDPGEVQALYHELLINVKSFFRDPELFETLKRTVFPMLMNAKPVDEPFRVWVAGCATGEEAYSIAIALTEFLDECATAPVIQIFATDLADDSIIDKARAGRYPQSIEGDVSSERLHRFFIKDDESYCINKSIRDRCVFSQHNITADPPFSRVDLISCRNVLIYMSPVLQQRVLPLFQYGLRVPGYLILGPAESIGPISDHFDVVDDKWKVYSKKPVTALQPPMIASNTPFGALTDRRRALRPASALDARSRRSEAAIVVTLQPASDPRQRRFQCAGISRAGGRLPTNSRWHTHDAAIGDGSRGAFP